jgi:hypothetical protein
MRDYYDNQMIVIISHGRNGIRESWKFTLDEEEYYRLEVGDIVNISFTQRKVDYLVDEDHINEIKELWLLAIRSR